jgi:hypothetical protein
MSQGGPMTRWANPPCELIHPACGAQHFPNRLEIALTPSRYAARKEGIENPCETGMRIRLTIWGFAQLFAFGAAVIFVLISFALNGVKHALYYSKVDAIVQTAGMGCSVRGLTESMRSFLANNPKLANEQWFDCSDVRGMIASFGTEAKVSWRQQAHVRFVSPADGQERVSLVALTVDQSRTIPVSGTTLPIYAHKKDPGVVDPYY